VLSGNGVAHGGIEGACLHAAHPAPHCLSLGGSLHCTRLEILLLLVRAEDVGMHGVTGMLQARGRGAARSAEYRVFSARRTRENNESGGEEMSGVAIMAGDGSSWRR